MKRDNQLGHFYKSCQSTIWETVSVVEGLHVSDPLESCYKHYNGCEWADSPRLFFFRLFSSSPQFGDPVFGNKESASVGGSRRRQRSINSQVGDGITETHVNVGKGTK